MNIAKKLLIAALLSTLFGCLGLPSQKTWYKSGATEEQFRRDMMSCRQYGMQSAQANGVAGNMFVEAWIQQQANECMSGLGYGLTDANATPSSNLASARAEIQNKVKQICNAPENKEYYSKTACLSADITLEQMADPSRITAAQKPVLLKVRTAADALNKQDMKLAREMGGTAGNRIADIYDTYTVPQNDKNTLDLYNGRITWGEYNRKRKEITADGNAQFKKITNQ